MNQEERKNILKTMRICRICLEEEDHLENIFEKDQNDIKQMPLSLQITSVISIEVFSNDGFPELICNKCQVEILRFYQFRLICKEADEALRLYLLKGVWNKPKIFDQYYLTSQMDSNNENVIPKKNKQTQIESNEALPRDTQNLKYYVDLNHIKTNKDLNDQQTVINFNQNNESNFQNNSIQILKNIQISKPTIERNSFVINIDNGDIESQNNQKPFQMESFKNNDFNDTLTIDDEPTNKLKYSCTQCDRAFPLKQLLVLHEKRHQRKRGYHCTQCEKQFYTKYDLSVHKQMVHNAIKEHSCVICYKTFSKEFQLRRHEEVHKDAGKYLCSKCDLTFLDVNLLLKHQFNKHANGKYSCILCKKNFQLEQGLRRHIENWHKKAEEHTCDYCEEKFRTLQQLARHIITHVNARPFPCKFCSRTFLLSHHLTRHLRTHSESKVDNENYNLEQNSNFKCSECTMIFKRKDGLIGHSTIHSMVSLRCIFCYKKFDNLIIVREHVKTHLTGRVYQCDQCDFTFLTRKHLDDHMITHLSDIAAQQKDPVPSEENANEKTSNVRLFDSEDEEVDADEEEIEENEEESNIYTTNKKMQTVQIAKIINNTLIFTEDDEIENDDEDLIDSTYQQNKLSLEEGKSVIDLRDELDEELSIKSEKSFDGYNDDSLKHDSNELSNLFDDNSLESGEGFVEFTPKIKVDHAKTYKSKISNKKVNKQNDNISKSTDESLNVQDSSGKTLESDNSSCEKKDNLQKEKLSLTDVETVNTTEKFDYLENAQKRKSIGEAKEMKIGHRTVKIRKVLLTKAEVEEMARQGKIKINNGTIIVESESLPNFTDENCSVQAGKSNLSNQQKAVGTNEKSSSDVVEVLESSSDEQEESHQKISKLSSCKVSNVNQSDTTNSKTEMDKNSNEK